VLQYVITVRSGIFLVHRPRAIPNYDTLLPDLPCPFAPAYLAQLVPIAPLLVELTTHTRLDTRLLLLIL
jgi:hypothetical protein